MRVRFSSSVGLPISHIQCIELSELSVVSFFFLQSNKKITQFTCKWSITAVAWVHITICVTWFFMLNWKSAKKPSQILHSASHSPAFNFIANRQITSHADKRQVFKLGVTSDSSYETPQSAYMKRDERSAWLAERAFIALFIASQRGHEDFCLKLLKTGMGIWVEFFTDCIKLFL